MDVPLNSTIPLQSWGLAVWGWICCGDSPGVGRDGGVEVWLFPGIPWSITRPQPLTPCLEPGSLGQNGTLSLISCELGLCM